MGERVLHRMLPILRDSMASESASTRQVWSVWANPCGTFRAGAHRCCTADRRFSLAAHMLTPASFHST